MIADKFDIYRKNELKVLINTLSMSKLDLYIYDDQKNVNLYEMVRKALVICQEDKE